MIEVFGPLKPVHHEQVMGLVQQSGGQGAAFHWPEEALRPELQHALGWGLWRDDQMMAFVLWRDLGAEAEITCLATAPAVQGRGCMKALLDQVFNAHRHKFWLLEVHEGNQPARNLYESLGFMEVGRRPRYYRDGSAAILLQRPGESG